MKIGIFFLTIIFSSFSIAKTIQIDPDEVKDYDENLGIGCSVSESELVQGSFYIVCKSKHSAELAWNSVLYRGKMKCPSEKFNMLFKRPPSIPESNGVFGAQMDIECIKP